MRALVRTLGLVDPPRVVHVVGTNGKGSVSHALAAMAQAAGERAGRFTSPHVESLHERVAVDGRHVDDDTLASFVARVRPLVESGALPDVGFFEWMLALALQHFAAQRVTLAVVEAGVGARHDPTLAVGNVTVGVLTNVALDHVETLGPTVEAIARDKAEVVRDGVPLVTAAREGALAVVREVAAERGSLLLELCDDDPRFALPEGVVGASLGPPTHVENLRLACATGRLLGWSEAALRRGCSAPLPPARFERFTLADRLVVLDGAHDPAAARALAGALPRPYVLLFGALGRKQGADTLAPLAEGATTVVVTRADPLEEMPSWPADARHDDPVAALDEALERAGAGGTVVVAGSLYLAGRLRPHLRSRSEARGGVAATERGAIG
jgi:dihydrofolate synthase / folylpolyglutamate synthase